MPRVGLLSVGAEPGKGDRLRQATDAALRLHQLTHARYVGPVEGHDVVLGTRADVVVTDGFTGNVLLKGVEAALAAAPTAFPSAAVPRAAALLGVAGPVVVCHGAATGEDVASGLALAARLVRGQHHRSTDRERPAADRCRHSARGGEPAMSMRPTLTHLEEAIGVALTRACSKRR
jgi:fatty acid/phospholipid biosynthesis enzyme